MSVSTSLVPARWIDIGAAGCAAASLGRKICQRRAHAVERGANLVERGGVRHPQITAACRAEIRPRERGDVGLFEEIRTQATIVGRDATDVGEDVERAV